MFRSFNPPARNCAYLTFPYNHAKHFPISPYTQQPLLLASLKSTRLLFLNPKQWSISKPYIMCVVCVNLYRIAIYTTCSYTGNAPQNLWNSKYCVREIHSKYYDFDRKQKVPLQHTQPRQAKYSIGNSCKSLISRMHNSSGVPT